MLLIQRMDVNLYVFNKTLENGSLLNKQHVFMRLNLSKPGVYVGEIKMQLLVVKR